jgi:DNA-binding MarR family transcriptional regulator
MLYARRGSSDVGERHHVSTTVVAVDRPHPPLARLFAMAFAQLIDDLHEQLEQRGWTDVRRSYGFVLLSLREGTRNDADTTITATDIASLLGVSKQAASKLIDAMADSGYVQRASSDDDRRQRPLELSRRGHRLLAVVEEIYADLEQAWADEIGVGAVDQMRANVARVLLTRNDNVFPPVRPTW